MLLDDYIPFYDVGEHHEIMVRARPENIYPAFWQVDLSRSGLVKLLFEIRMIPSRLAFWADRPKKNTLKIEDLLDVGFILLAEDKPRELVLGLVGRFWKPVPKIRDVPPEKFQDFNEHGYGKIGWNLFLEEADQGIMRVITQTRVRCLGLRPLMRFLPYWLAIRPFSGLIRKKMLIDIKQMAEEAEKAEAVKKTGA